MYERQSLPSMLQSSIIGNKSWLEPAIRKVRIPFATMKDLETLCYFLFYNWYGIFIRLHDRGNTYRYGQQVEL
jgi:hypothetical protein